MGFSIAIKLARYSWALLVLILVARASSMVETSDVTVPSTRRRLQQACGNRNIPPCRVRAPRDLVFLIDASDSIDPSRFYGPMLDYVQALWCSLNVNDLNRGAVISFGQTVRTLVPLNEYTQQDWFDHVDKIREDPQICCKCCTPTAEAFRAARLMLAANPSPDISGIPVVRIVFTITDGDPWQNKNPLPGHPGMILSTSDYWLWPATNAAEYRYQIVPQEALKLKKMDDGRDVRVMLIGVPNKMGQAPEQGYFSGKPDPKLGKGFTQCIKRGARPKKCVKMDSPPFPIVSVPIEKNLFNPATWDVDQLIADTVDDLCEILPTSAPTFAPTSQAPSKTPTKSPTRRPTTRIPTLSPTPAPTPQPTSKPTKSPTSFPTKSPTRPPTTGPSTSPTNQPTANPIFRPTKSPTGKPTKRPTFQPTTSPSKAPTTSRPTSSPTEKPVFDGLDLFLYVDRSRSMRWRWESCRNAPGANPAADNDHVCWELFLYFVDRLVTKGTQLKYDGVNEIGWQDNMADKTKGLRVWIYGFACSGGQKVPIVERIGEKLNSLAAFQAAMDSAQAIVPDGGTCPGAAIERSVMEIMSNDLLERPYKAALLLTDGVFYDQPRPQNAAKGLFYFGVLTYALGIAIPENGNNMGLKPGEIKNQRAQLLAFVQNDPNRLINLGASGINALDSIAQSFVDKLPIDVAKRLPRVWLKPYWCGFSNNELCLSTDPNLIQTAKFCKWIPNNPNNFAGNGKCLDRCPYNKQNKCEADVTCEWYSGFCRPNAL